MTKKETLIVLGVALGLLILAIPLDLQFSSLVYDQSSWFGRAFEAIGEFPAMAVAMFSSAALIFTRNRKNLLSNIGSLILGGLFLGLSALMGGVLPFNYLDLSLIPGFVLAFVYVVIAVLLVKRIPTQYYPQLRRAAWIGLMTFIVSMVLVNLIKMGWGRMRFRAMEESVSGFSPWYLPQGFNSNEEFKSFPSGHVANAALILFITLLPSFIPALEKHKIKLKFVVYGWVILVALSRIVMGAHFISDVTVGFVVTLLVFLLFSKVYKVKAIQ
jgi:membrane-associated phospholipid phosphatase